MAGTWVALAAIEFVILGVFTAWLLWFYAAKGTHWSALGIVFISWYLGFFGTMFLPIDVAEAYYPTENNETIWYGFSASASPSPSASLSASPWATWSLSPTLKPSPSPKINDDFTTSTDHPPLDEQHWRSAELLSSSEEEEGEGAVSFRAAHAEGLDALRGGQPAAEAEGAVWSAEAAAVDIKIRPRLSSAAPPLSLPLPLHRLLAAPPNATNATNTTAGGGAGWTIVEARNGPLEAMWFAVYWITFLLTYIFIPVVQEYVVAGESRGAAALGKQAHAACLPRPCPIL